MTTMFFKRRDNELGRTYQDGEFIFREGEAGECLYVILEGQVEILTGDPTPFLLDVLGRDDVFGAISLFDGLPRPVSTRARGQARVLTLDRKMFMQRLEDDPSLALRIMENIARRTRRYITELVQLKRSLACEAMADALVTQPPPAEHQKAPQHIPAAGHTHPSDPG